MPKHLRRTLAKRKHDVVIAMTTAGLSVGFLLFPAAANWANARLHAAQLSGWAQTVNTAAPTEITELLAAAEAYNARLAAGREGLLDESDPGYRAQLRVAGTQVISRVMVPSINVALPIFHGTGGDVLEIGAGHLYGTALPVGNRQDSGFGTHGVITAHSGIDTNHLFNDIHDLTYGDLFFIETAGRQMFYRVDQITIVPADTLKAFNADNGDDLVTLLTCTPIGINSHRLLVRGSRYFPLIPDAEEITAVTRFRPAGQQFPTFALAWPGSVATAGAATHLLVKPKKKSRRL